MRVKQVLTLAVIPLFVLLVLVSAEASPAKTPAKKAVTKTSMAKKHTVVKKTTRKPSIKKTKHAQKVHKAALTERSNPFSSVAGSVVRADIDSNTLVLDSHGKDMKFSVPGRIDMLNLKPGGHVRGEYIAEGNTLRLWELNAH